MPPPVVLAGGSTPIRGKGCSHRALRVRATDTYSDPLSGRLAKTSSTQLRCSEARGEGLQGSPAASEGAATYANGTARKKGLVGG
jgi:hypothetical protein